MIDINLLDLFGNFQDRFGERRDVLHTTPPMEHPVWTYRYLEARRTEAARVR